MEKIHKTAGKQGGFFSRFLRYPALITGIIAVITILFATQLPTLRLDNNNIRFLPEGNQARVISDYIDNEFGGSVVILVGLERHYGTVFDTEFLATLKVFSAQAEDIEFVKDVNSIMSTKYITGNSESIIVTDLVPQDFSGRQAEIAELKRRIASWELFQGALVSNDHQATQVLVTLNVTTEEQTSPEVSAALFAIRSLAQETFAGLAEVYVTGLPVINATINEAMIADNIVLIPLALVIMLAVLFFSFRRFSFVMLPFLTVVVAIIWTAGIMAMLGLKLSILTTILPVILLAVGNSYAIHVVAHYMSEYKEQAFSTESHRTLVFDLMHTMIRPVFLAAITTFAGFISFCFTSIVPMREFGIFAGIGVIASFIVTVTLVPALLLLRGPKAVKDSNHSERLEADRFSDRLSELFLAASKRKTLILFVTVLVTGISLFGLSKIIVDNVLVEFFQNETDISRSDRFINEHFGGSKELTIIVTADSSEELLSPAVLTAVDNLSAWLIARIPEVGKVVGFTDIIKRINQVFNVGESPDGWLGEGKKEEGIGKREEREEDGEWGFGFGDDFGFGFGDDFGFGFSDYEGDEAYMASQYDEQSMSKVPDYTAADLIAFLDTAAGNHADMNANDVVRELKRLVNYEGFSYYEIPSDPERYAKTTPEELQRLVSNYLVLLAGDDSNLYSNDPLEPTALKTTVQLRTTGSRDALAIISRINGYVDANFPDNVKVVIGGGANVEGAVTDLILNSQIISIAVSVLIVFLIIALFYKSFAAGFIGAVPLAIAILCNFAVMGFTGVKLNIGTALVANLALSIGIDYTIHFIESFKREYWSAMRTSTACQSGEANFLRRTFVGCGKAIIIDSVSVGAGFAVLALSQFRIVAQLGSLVALSMMIAALVSLTVIPALIITIKPHFIYGVKK